MTHAATLDDVPVARLPSNPFFLVAKNTVLATNLTELIA